MSHSTSPTLLDKTVYIPFGSFVHNIVSGIVAIVIVIAAFTFAILVGDTWAIVLGSLVGLIFIFGLIMLPISAAIDVGGRIPEVKTARELDENLKKIEIRHPYLWLIVLLTIAGFWSVIGWFVAMAWACSPGKVVIPDKLYDAAFSKNSLQDQSDQASIADTIHKQNNPTGLEAELMEINQLLAKDLITKDEAEKRRTVILGR
jgi:hypothetical protein